MRILQIAPNHETVPPARDGGTERIVYELSQELSRRGHEVILYAPAGSEIAGTLIPYPFIGDDYIADYVLGTLPQGIDVIHDHTFDSSVGRLRLDVPTICTIHLATRNEVDYPVYVSRSALERVGGNYGWYVYNGLIPEHYQFSEMKQDYLLFMGRLIRDKGILEALDIAEYTGHRLLIAGPIHDYELFANYISPRINQNPNLHYLGAVGGQLRQDLLKYAKCLLFPTQWEEPFGLVLIEAMACGTPVLALANGAVPDLLHGCSEAICYSVGEMVEKLLHFEPWNRGYALREYVNQRFTVEKMTDRYLELYWQVGKGASW